MYVPRTLEKTLRMYLNKKEIIASEIVKKDLELRYWRSKSKAEVDFVITKNNKNYPLEVKSILTSEKVTRSFMSFIEKYKPEKGIIANDRFFGSKKEKGTIIEFAPIFYISRVIDKLS